ncbi:hypothetical protein EJB05_32130, partial [Eragrostis curvula]
MAGRGGRGRGGPPQEEWGEWGQWPPQQHSFFHGQLPPPYGYFPNPPPPHGPQQFGYQHQGPPHPRPPLGGRGQGSGTRPRGPAPRHQDLQKNKQQTKPPQKDEVPPSSSSQQRNVKIDCFNCNEPGHFSSDCPTLKLCHICKSASHDATHCPEWQKHHEIAEYYESANEGLGFFHVDVNPRPGRVSNWVKFDNCAVVTVEEGTMDKESIEKSFAEIFDKDWPWQLKPLDDSRYLVRFPPHRKLKDMIYLEVTYFPLNKDGVLGSLKIWDGEIEAHQVLEEVWVQVRGVPPKWSDFITFKQIASTLGRLLDIDWGSQMNSFFAMTRVKIVVKNPVKIPCDRLMEMDKKLYWVNFKVEGGIVQEEDDGNENKGDDDSKKDDKGNEESTEEERMDTNQTRTPEGKGSGKDSDKGSKPGGMVKGSCSKGSKTVNSWTSLFREDYMEQLLPNELSNFVGCNLIKEMELLGSDSEEEENAVEYKREDSEMIELPEKLVNNIMQERGYKVKDLLDGDLVVLSDSAEMIRESQNDEDNTNLMDMAAAGSDLEHLTLKEDQQRHRMDSKKKEATQKWGPVVAEKRSLRNRDDGRTMLEKAQDRKKKHNLEVNQEHFDSVASIVGIEFDNDAVVKDKLIEEILEIEIARSSGKGSCGQLRLPKWGIGGLLGMNGIWKDVASVWGKITGMIKSWAILCPTKDVEAYGQLVVMLEMRVTRPERLGWITPG